MKKFLVFLSFLMVLATSPARAAIDDAGAGDLKALIEKELSWRALPSPAQTPALPAAKVVSVTPKGDFYEVKISNLVLPFFADKTAGPMDVVAHAKPGKPGEWILTAALPSAFMVNDAQQGILGRAILGTQKLTATWLPEEGIYPKIDARYGDVKMRSATSEEVIFSAKNLGIISALDSQDQSWGGGAGLMAEDILIVPPANPGLQLFASKLSFQNTYKGLDLQAQSTARKNMQPLAPLSRLADVASVSLYAAGLSYGEAHKPPVIKLARLAAEGQLQDLRHDKASGDVKAGFEGFSQSNAAPALAALFPKQGNVNVHLDKLPATDILSRLKEAMLAQQKGSAPPSDLSQSLSGLMQQAGTTLEFRDTYLKSETLDAKLTGGFQAASTAPRGFAGKALLSVRGFDAALKRLKSNTSDPQAMGIAGALTGILLAGHVAPTDDKTVLYELDVSGTDGAITMNGINVETLMSALSAHP